MQPTTYVCQLVTTDITLVDPMGQVLATAGKITIPLDSDLQLARALLLSTTREVTLPTAKNPIILPSLGASAGPSHSEGISESSSKRSKPTPKDGELLQAFKEWFDAQQPVRKLKAPYGLDAREMANVPFLLITGGDKGSRLMMSKAAVNAMFAVHTRRLLNLLNARGAIRTTRSNALTTPIRVGKLDVPFYRIKRNALRRLV